MAIRTAIVSNVKLGGSVGTAIGNLQSATLTMNIGTVDTTGFGDTWAEYIALVKSWGLSVTCAYDNVDAGVAILQTEFMSGDCVQTSLCMFVNTAATTSYFLGDSIITGFSLSIAGPDTVTLTFLGNGALTLT